MVATLAAFVAPLAPIKVKFTTAVLSAKRTKAGFYSGMMKETLYFSLCLVSL